MQDHTHLHRACHHRGLDDHGQLVAQAQEVQLEPLRACIAGTAHVESVLHPISNAGEALVHAAIQTCQITWTVSAVCMAPFKGKESQPARKRCQTCQARDV
eukprot:1145730-Pelagomonas_calceolata.AAC.4